MATTRRFKFDKPTGISVSTGLTHSFSRGVATVNPKSEAVAANNPRWDGPLLVPSITAPSNVFATAASTIFASGVDDDGSTELMVYHDHTNHHLYVFHGGTITTSGNPLTFSNPVQYNRTTLTTRFAESGKFDDLFTSGDGFSIADAVIFHGVIVLVGLVYQNGPVGWERKGVGFVVSQDQGVTWTRLWDDTASPASDQGPKLREWCLSAAPVWNRSSQIQGSPLECWICSSDYRHSTSSTGGRVYVFRMARPNASTAWSFGPVSGTGLVKYFDIPGAIRAHAHAAQITEYSTTGLQMLASMGDGLQNRLVRYVMANRNLDYTNAANWSVTDDYHGRRPQTGVIATSSFQPIGAAFGPEKGTVLWGSDQYTDWLNLVKMPDIDGTGFSAQCSIEHIYGFATGSMYRPTGGSPQNPIPNIFVMNQARPETNGPIVASYLHQSHQPRRCQSRALLAGAGCAQGRVQHTA
ncbi:MAG: hypothetical protein H7Y88_11415 [Phycisphaerales bacterium]|nr:hypothetical protein [Phycisphaerales bacterium]